MSEEEGLISRAFFTFLREREEGEYNVRFRWRGMEASHTHSIPNSVFDRIKKTWPVKYDPSADPYHIANELKVRLRDIGGYIYSRVIFCGERCPIKVLFKKFDEHAIKVREQGEGALELAIETNVTEIPWEITLTSSQTADTVEHWFQRYIVARIPHYRFIKVSPREKKEIKVLLITKPSYEEFHDIQKRCEGFMEEYGRLEELINRLNSSKNLKVDHIKGVESGLFEIETKLREHYDLVVYVGIYLSDEGKLKCHHLGKDEYADVDIMIPEPETPIYEAHPIFFLDACSTVGLERKEQEGEGRIIDLPMKFLAEGDASAFIGTFQQVEAVLAHAFIRFFLSSLFDEELSLAGALYKARKNTEKYFMDKDRYSPLRQLQCSLYALCARDQGVAFSAPTFGAEREVRIIWPDVLDDYYNGFKKKTIVPLAIRKIFAERPEMFHRLVHILKTEKQLPVVADLPIITASNLMREEPEKYVIIGSVFKPIVDDCALFILNGENPKDLEGKPVYHAGNDISVTTFFRLLLRSMKIDEKKIHPFTEIQDYRTLEKNMWTHIITQESHTLGYVLAGGSYFSMKGALKELQKKGLPRTKVNEIRTREEACRWIKAMCGDLPFELPATVIVARYEDVKRQPKPYYELLRALDSNLSKVWEELKFKVNQDIYDPWVKVSPRLIKEIHSKLVFLHERQIRGIIYFTKCLENLNLVSLEDRKSKLLERPLDIDDVLPLSKIPDQWKNMTSEEVRVEVKEKLERWKKGLQDNVIGPLEKAIQAKRDKISPNKHEEVRSFLEEIEKRYRKYIEKIKEIDSKLLLESLQIKISYLENDYKSRKSQILREL